MRKLLEYVKRNPYRVLGVYANDPEKKWVENSLELFVSLKRGNTFMFPTDWVDVLGPINRTIHNVKDAAFLLEEPTARQIESLFWVHNVSRDSFYANHNEDGMDLEMDDAFTVKLYSQSINKAISAIVEGNLDKALNSYKIAFNYKRPSSEILFEFFDRVITEFFRVSPNGNPFTYLYRSFGDDFRPEFERVLVARTKKVNQGCTVSTARTETNKDGGELERETDSTKNKTLPPHKIEWNKVCAKLIKPWAQFNRWTYFTIVLFVILIFCLIDK